MTASRKKGADSLEHYEQVSLYETAFKRRKEDVAFFLRAAEEWGGPILEYGAGAGRITFPLASAGHEVRAVDASRPMLARLEERLQRSPKAVQARIQVAQGDMRRYRTEARFPLVFATFNVVGHLSTFKDMGAFLKRAREHLSPGGRLVFDVPLPQPEELEADQEELFPAPRFKHPDTGAWIRQTERFSYDPSTQVLLVESQFREEGSADTLTIPLRLRQWFPKEVEAILEYEGFGRVETFADYTQNPGILAQDTLIFVASRS